MSPAHRPRELQLCKLGGERVVQRQRRRDTAGGLLGRPAGADAAFFRLRASLGAVRHGGGEGGHLR